MRNARIGQQGYIRERQPIADKKTARGKFVIHSCQRRIAALDLVGIEIRRRPAEIDDLETAVGNVRLVAELFPEQPFIHLGRSKSSGWNEITVSGEITDDGVGLGERAAILEIDDRHLPRAVEFEEL